MSMVMFQDLIPSLLFVHISVTLRLTRPKESGEAIEVAGQKVPLGIPGADNYW
jgi:hypothetical protein